MESEMSETAEIETTVLAWHFTAGDKLRDGRPVPPVGEWLRHEGEIEICRTGLHASERLFDALGFAPGNMLHRVECRDIRGRESDKFVCRERRILWSLDAEPVLRAFSRRVALDVAHLWDMPTVVREYLETGNEDLRDAARNVTRAATWDAAMDAAWAAARYDAWAAAWAAATDAARYDARDAATDAARAAAITKYGGWLVEMIEATRSAA